MAMIKILLSGDSLGLPRDGVSYEQSYPFLLEEKLNRPEIRLICRCSRAAKMTDWQLWDDLMQYKPDIAVVHLGIVDCAPRLFRDKGVEHVMMELLPAKMKNAYIKLIKRIRKRSTRRSYTSPENFGKAVENYLEQAKTLGCRVIFVPIAAPGRRYLELNPGSGAAIVECNRVMAEKVAGYANAELLENFENSADYDDHFIPEDGYHLSARGNATLAEKLAEKLNLMTEKKS